AGGYSPATTAARTTGVRRTENVYDADGRVTLQREPSFSEGATALHPVFVVSSVSGSTQIAISGPAVPVGATVSLKIALVGTSPTWITIPVTAGFPLTYTVPSGTQAGLYQYQLTFTVPNQ